VVPTAHNLGLYGQGWRYLAPEHARAEHVPNEQLHRLYSSADIVLADHWDDMRHHGFVSNRICDALACGAFVLCDDFPALHDLFAEGLETFATREDLRAKVERYLGDPEARVAVARRGRRLVLESHTADRRAASSWRSSTSSVRRLLGARRTLSEPAGPRPQPDTRKAAPSRPCVLTRHSEAL
jgi:spore maturation protein CgeB